MDPQRIMEEFQILQQQLQSIVIQTENSKMQVLEIDKALEEIEGTKEDVYKASGMILIKTDPKKLSKDLKEKKDEINVRMKSLERQDKRIRDKLTELQDKLIKKSSSDRTAE